MALDNSKTITAVTYNGNDWPVGGAPNLQSKSVTYTANGTATITSDEGYDGLSSVNVTVDVSGGGGGGSVGAVPLLSGSIQALPDGHYGVNFGNVYDIFSAYGEFQALFVIVAGNKSDNTMGTRIFMRNGFTLEPMSSPISIFNNDIDLINSSLEDLTISNVTNHAGKISIYYLPDLCI